MRITDRVPVPPRCLGTVVARVPDEPLRSQLMAAFATEEVLARDREWHARLGRPGSEYVPLQEEMCMWSVTCTCGADTGKLLGVRRDDVYVPPVCFACGGCGKTFELFDETVDGYIGETEKKRKRRKAKPASTFALRCTKCKGTAWKPAVVLTYQGEAVPVAATAGDAAGVADRWQDYFDVMAFGGTCVRCGEVGLAACFECA